MKRRLASAALGLVASGAMAAEPCMENFKSEGNFLSGKKYSTWAVVSGVSQDHAFQKAVAFTVANGFTVTSASKDAGVISAAQTVSYGQGKTVPLGIVLQPDGGNLRISMNYATSGGVMSPDDAIKRHFCMTIASASEGGASAPAARNTGVVPPPAQAQQRRSMPGYAMPTPAQQDAYVKEVPKLAKDARIRAMVEEAASEIAGVIEKEACLAEYTGASALGVHGAPETNFGERYKGLRYPMRQTPYHDKGQCLSVKRVHGWKAPANNALQFEVLYTAADSGETATMSHEVVKQPDGTWLFTR